MAKKGTGRVLKTPPPAQPNPAMPALGAEKWIPLAIVLSAALAYANSLHVPFLFDDRYHIVENARIRQFWPPWPFLLHSSRPVIYLSLALNYALGQLDPVGYHLFNVAVHVAAALVLYGILRRTFLSSRLRPRFGTAAAFLAGLIALLWCIHPIQTEAVTYTIQRGESMMGLFYLLTLYCVIRGWYVAAVAGCCLGVGCKGVILTAPLMVLLYDRAFLASSWREIVRQRWGLYAALAATWLLYPLLLAQAPAEWKESAGFGYAGAAPLQYAITQPAVILHYLWLVVWPAGLCLDYGWPVAHGFGDEFAPMLIVLALLAATVWAWRRYPALSFLGLWFFVILIPTSSFIPIADVAVEHRMYLSLAAVIALVVAGLYGRFPRGVLAGGAIAALALTAATIRRNDDYSSELSIWRDTVEKSPRSARGQYDYAHSLEADNRTQEAILHYQKAIEAQPDYVDPLNNLGHVLALSGKAPEAEGYLRRAIHLKPELAEAHLNLGFALAQQNKIKDAIGEWQETIRLRPDLVEARNNLGIALAMDGRRAEAINQWEQALQLAPGAADTHNNLAYALSQEGRAEEAIAHYEEAVRLRPDYAQAMDGYARLLATLPPAEGGDANRAIELATRACALTGNREPAYLETLALAHAAAGRRGAR